jgi:hypothetical protein
LTGANRPQIVTLTEWDLTLQAARMS